VTHADHLVAGDQRFADDEDARSPISVVVQVRPADPDVTHPQPNLASIWLWAGKLLGPHVLLGMDPHRPHALILPAPLPMPGICVEALPFTCIADLCDGYMDRCPSLRRTGDFCDFYYDEHQGGHCRDCRSPRASRHL